MFALQQHEKTHQNIAFAWGHGKRKGLSHPVNTELSDQREQPSCPLTKQHPGAFSKVGELTCHKQGE